MPGLVMITIHDCGRQLGILSLVTSLVALLCGCTHRALAVATTRDPIFRGVQGAYYHDGKFGIIYTMVRYRAETSVLWFRGDWPTEEQSPVSIPVGAVPVPVFQIGEADSPTLPPGVRMAVFTRRHSGARGARHEAECLVVRAEDGETLQQSLLLPLGSFQAWWYYPLIPLALSLDIVAFPVQVCTSPIWYHP